MIFNELIKVLQDSEIDEQVKFTHGDMMGYFVKSDLGEFIYHLDGKEATEVNFFLSDFDRDDWEIVN